MSALLPVLRAYTSYWLSLTLKPAVYLFCVVSTMREMALSTPRRSQSDQAIWKSLETRKRLDKCWSEDIDWTLYPETLKNVSAGNAR